MEGWRGWVLEIRSNVRFAPRANVTKLEDGRGCRQEWIEGGGRGEGEGIGGGGSWQMGVH